MRTTSGSRLRRLAVPAAAAAIGWGAVAGVSPAAAATSARVCKTVTISVRVHGRTVHRHVRECESASIGVVPTTIPYSGGTVAFHLNSSNATSCRLAASPVMWSGRNPAPVSCRGKYTLAIPSTTAARSWTVRFTAKNRYKETVVVSQVVRERAAPPPSPNIPVSQSTNWSGYALVTSGATGAQGTFTVPTLNPTPYSAYMSEWVGVDGFADSDLIQTGIHEDYNPITSQITIYPWWEILPYAETPIAGMTVSPGDRVTGTVEQASPGIWTIDLKDNTTNQNFTTTQLYFGAGASADWIVEAPSIGGAVAPLADYTPAITFTGLAVNGTQVQMNELQMVQNGAVVSSPSPLDASGFSVAYGPAAPPAP